MIRKLRFGGAVRAGTTWRRGMTEGFFHELPELETERLKLRKLRMSDAQDMYLSLIHS